LFYKYFSDLKSRRMRPVRHVYVWERAEVEARFRFGNPKKGGLEEDIGLDGR
jgi:hypothetical protein